MFTIGETFELVTRITASDVWAFTRVSGDHNPLHCDEDFAARTRFREPIVHGLLVASKISALLGNDVAPPGYYVVYQSQQLEFRAPVHVGDLLRVRATVKHWLPDKNRLELRTDVFNRASTSVLEGTAVVRVFALAAPTKESAA
jgi:acyl dehydratase